MKTLLHLGGAYSQIPAIKYAVEAGYKVITCDYLPSNPGHKYSHKYFNVSTTDIEKVYQLACQLSIDGIASYASDPSAATVGYVAEKLSLPGPGYEASRALSDKGLFRQMMKSCGLRTPEYYLFSQKEAAIRFLESLRTPYIVKPVDSSGSKGVHHYREEGNTEFIVKDAFDYSRKKEIIVEELILTKSTQIQGEGFVIDGELRFILFGDQRFSAYNPNGPVSTSFPSRRSKSIMDELRNLVERAIKCIIEETDGNFQLLELGPRNGGNYMPQLVMRSAGVNLVELCIDVAMGIKPEIKFSGEIKPHTQLILHSSQAGYYGSLEYSEQLKNHIVAEYLHKKTGEQVNAYRGSQDVIGVVILDLPFLDISYNRTLDISQLIRLKING